MSAQGIDVVAMAAPYAAKIAKATSARSGKGGTARGALVRRALSNYFIGRTEDERTYLVAKEGPNIALFAASAKAHLARQHRQATGQTVGRGALDEAWMNLEGDARDQPKTNLPLRVATTIEGHLVIDLADPSGRAVVIASDGWSVVDRSPVTFRRSRAMLPLPGPERGGRVDELFNLLNVAPALRDLFVAWLCSSLFSGLPHPAVVLRGEQGAAKSSTAKAMTYLIDPCMAATQKPPANDEDWAMTCSARWIISVDNVSQVQPWWSDALCRTVTGDGWLRRMLYTDDDIVATSWRRCVILNGITLGSSLRSDLGERLVFFDLHRPSVYLTENEVQLQLDEMRARVLGALFDRAAQVLKALPSTPIVRDLRMADFATFLTAHDDLTGGNALAAYRRQLDDAFAEATEGDVIAMAVIDFMATKSEWEGTASDLLVLLPAPLGKGYWPTTGSHLSQGLARSVTSLERVGISVSHGTGRGRRTIKLEKLPPAPGTP